MIEAFWSRMQVELLDTRRWKTRLELANAIFEYIEIFHNRRRRHSSLGTRTPIEYERASNELRVDDARTGGERIAAIADFAGSQAKPGC